MECLARLVVRRRKSIVLLWVGLTVFGVFGATKASDRYLESFSMPGYSAYEANQRALRRFGTGEQAPYVAVFRSDGDVTKEAGISGAIATAAAESTRSTAWTYVSNVCCAAATTRVSRPKEPRDSATASAAGATTVETATLALVNGRERRLPGRPGRHALEPGEGIAAQALRQRSAAPSISRAFSSPACQPARDNVLVPLHSL